MGTSDIVITEEDLKKGAKAVLSGRHDTLMADLPQVISEIKKSKLRGSFDIKGFVVYNEQVLRTNTLKIFDQGSLIFSNLLKFRYVVIAAKEIIIDDPNVRAHITRPVGAVFDAAVADILDGITGGPGRDGKNGRGTDPHGHGNPGENGGEGQHGAHGGFLGIAPIFIFAQSIRLGTGTTPQHECVELYFDGLTGGNGGAGGVGGRGGNGDQGSTAADDIATCKRTGGDGGGGGYGGAPGRGGNAGRGGNGSSVFFLGPSDPLDMLLFFSVRQEGGRPGLPGGPGIGGVGGKGGAGGSGSIYCPGGRGGPDRTSQSLPRPDDGLGNPAVNGDRGDQDYLVRDNSDLF